MKLKHLTQFVRFNWDSFAKDKRFMTTGCSPLNDYETKEHIGTRVEVVITTDNTVYKQKDGENTTNRFEKLVFKVKKDIEIPLDSYVVPVNPVAKVYGEFKDNISITCDDIQVLSQSKGISHAAI